jgi:hypothetical protein
VNRNGPLAPPAQFSVTNRRYFLAEEESAEKVLTSALIMLMISLKALVVPELVF